MISLGEYESIIRGAYSLSTVKWMTHFVHRYLEFVGRRGLSVGVDSLILWVDELRRIGLSESSIRSAINAVNNYFTFAGVEVDKSRMKLLKRTVKAGSTRVDVLGEGEVKMIINAAPSYMYRVMFAIMYAYARRVSEVLALRWRDVDFENMTIKFAIAKKKVSETATFMMDKTVASMLATLKIIKGRPAKGERVFNVGERAVEKAFRKAVEAAGIIRYGRRITPHSLRRSRITHLLKRGYPLDVVSKYLARHSKFDTTIQFYRSITSEEVVEIPLLDGFLK